MIRHRPQLALPLLALVVLFAGLLPPWASPATAQGAGVTTQSKEAFAQGLREAVTDRLGGPEKFDQAEVHWILLLDTSQYQGTAPVADATGQVLETLFGSTIRRDDYISVLPFQVRPAPFRVWDQRVGRFEDLRPQIPGTSFADGHHGGRDIEAAVKATLMRLSSEGQSGKAVLLVVSSSRISEVPSGEPQYHLITGQDPGLRQLLSTQGMTPAISLVPVVTHQAGGDKAIPLYLQAYLPQSLTPVGQRPAATARLVGPAFSRPTSTGGTVLHESTFWQRYGRLLLAAIVLLFVVAVAWLVYRGWPPTDPPASPLLIMEHTNRRFPESRRIEVFGPGIAPAAGTAQDATKISMEHGDLPPASQGSLFTLIAGDRKAVTVQPNLYRADPATFPYDQETAVRLIPTDGVDGFPVQTNMTIRRA